MIDLRQLKEWTFSNPFSLSNQPNPNEDVWKYLKDAFITLHHLQLLLRFVDDRNPKVFEYPDVNGKNLQDPDLKLAWVLHVSFWSTPRTVS